MSEPSLAVRRRLERLRRRRAAMAAARAAFEERRRYGLAARHRAKLAHLTRRETAPAAETLDEPDNNKEAPTTTESHDDAA